MKTFLTILGALLLLMGFYVIVTAIMIVFGWTETSFSEISIPFFILVIAFAFKVYSIMKPDKQHIKKKVTEVNTLNEYNPNIDILKYAIYEQKSETWWSDSDGDSHTRPTIYANLRFYENGTVIGIRDRGILKIENENSYVYKGQWQTKENTIEFNLEKIKDVNDKVDLDISEHEHRDMKYAGHVANNDDIIKAGIFKGLIKDNSLHVGKFKFDCIKTSRLIITASKNMCDSFEKQFKNHPLVLGSYTNSGNWYSNGETGPEWHTVTFESRYELKDKLEESIKEYSSDYSNMFWS
jgi:hypothetical protein